MTFRRGFVMSGALALLAAMSVPSYAQDDMGSGGMPQGQSPFPQSGGTERERECPPPVPAGVKLSKDEISQYQKIRAVLDAVSAGKQPAPADDKVAFHNHFIKSGEDVYVPYELDLEMGKLASFPLVMYVRAVAKSPAVAAMPGGKPAGGKVAAKAPACGGLAFENVSFVTPAAGGKAIQGAMGLVPGDYDIYIALSEKPSKDKKAPAPKTVVFNESLTVPNLTTGLATSSIILAKSVEAAEKQLNAKEQLEQPFTIAGYKIIPTFTAGFPKSGELLWVFYIYNEGAAANGKPDLNVEYNFFRAAEAKPFTNLPPSPYNATSLPPEFNLALGHQVFVGQGVPLTTFAPGDYRVEIKITDKTNSQTVTKALPFAVTP
jgi:hypothetical protein